MKRLRGRSNRQVAHQAVHLPEAFLEGCAVEVSLEGCLGDSLGVPCLGDSLEDTGFSFTTSEYIVLMRGIISSAN